MRMHTPHMTDIAGGKPAERRAVLDNADERLVRALSSAARVAHADGSLPREVYEKHSRKMQIALSPRKALRTKHALVVSQRGGAFWSRIVKAALPVLAGLAGTAVVGPIGGAAASTLVGALT